MEARGPSSQYIVDGIAYDDTMSSNLDSKANNAGNSYRKSPEGNHF